MGDEQNGIRAAGIVFSHFEVTGKLLADLLKIVPQQDGADKVAAADAYLGAIDGGHFDDRVDPVVVKPEGQQKEEYLPVPAQVVKTDLER